MVQPIKELNNVWKNIREVDLRPIRESAERPLRFAIIGKKGVGRHTLAAQMRQDPSRPNHETRTPIGIFDLETQNANYPVDLSIVMVEAGTEDVAQEQALVKRLADTGLPVLVFINKMDLLKGPVGQQAWVYWEGERVVYGTAEDDQSLYHEFVPAMMALLPGDLLALGRQFPLFRVPIARHLINETGFSNSAYSLSTGIAEAVPALGIPLNIADMIVLTKAQAFLVYRLGLLLGFSTQWQDYIAEFGSVIGGGFLWRQIARQLVGLIPVWGIIPKVAVAYSGTYVVGHAVLRWYLTGKHLTREQVRELYLEAFDRGKALARGMVRRDRRPRLFRKKQAQLPPPAQLPAGKTCPSCGRLNNLDAKFCQYCGENLEGKST